VNYPHPITSEVISEYRDRGFVVTTDLFDPQELDTYAAAVDEEVSRRTRGDTRDITEKSTYEQSFIQCMRLWETSREVQKLTFNSGLASVAAQLMGVKTLRLWQDQALYKEPGGRKTDAHQDQTFWPIGDVPLISAWIPFDDVKLEHGAMAYVPGSHQRGPLKVVDITHSTAPYNILEDPALNGEQPEYVEVQAGSVIWHSGFTVHEAAANNSSQPRRVFTVVFIADGYRRTKPWPMFPLDRGSIAVGDLMQHDGMPVIWPTPDVLPQPPTDQGQLTGPQHTSG
jgi:ectoine hydroxylase-related dioxygenase (phytanoyl-CoA dioxygenase family)